MRRARILADNGRNRFWPEDFVGQDFSIKPFPDYGPDPKKKIHLDGSTLRFVNLNHGGIRAVVESRGVFESRIGGSNFLDPPGVCLSIGLSIVTCNGSGHPCPGLLYGMY